MTLAISPERFDVIVVGAGPGGTLTALMLAQRGRKVAIVDRDLFPRFAIGESSTPIASRAIEQIAHDYDLPELLPLATWGAWRSSIPGVGGGLKRGFTYLDHRNLDHQLDGFNDLATSIPAPRRLLVAASMSDEVGDTHWVRSDVDSYLVDGCRRRGVTVLLGYEVESVSNQSPWRLGLTDRMNLPAGRPASFTADILVDASGRSAALLQRMGYRDVTDRLRTQTSARWTHAVNVPAFTLTLGEPPPYPPDAAAVHHLVNDGWVWQLPMSDGRTSFGRVWKGVRPFPSTRFRPLGGADFGGGLADGLDVSQHRSLADYLANGSLASDPGCWYSSDRVQRLWERPGVNDRWSLDLLPLPTTVATIDPLHSTGLAHAISGAQRIADLISRGAADEVERYQKQVGAEVALLDRVVSLAYRVMENSQLFYSACMLYFAIAISDEEDRAEGGFRPDRATWFADRLEVVDVVSQIETSLMRSFSYQKPLHPAIVHDCLQTICHVELACRDDNLYGYTFA
ncbi:ribulose-1,5-biphosphate synthetase [Neorhodopirellula pilleata]|uniref:Ribulose-1,5-biphosphate synthetase n=2 Tax=Neorhodopirellula pilleata TaxID=2714738 RepID=A0A5C5ZZL1_9BACT|nr:ribulose-1,5-biphosphate synthetase [Neorhodopirellula pilleata]